jgi:hypothetical protein
VCRGTVDRVSRRGRRAFSRRAGARDLSLGAFQEVAPERRPRQLRRGLSSRLIGHMDDLRCLRAPKISRDRSTGTSAVDVEALRALTQPEDEERGDQVHADAAPVARLAGRWRPPRPAAPGRCRAAPPPLPARGARPRVRSDVLARRPSPRASAHAGTGRGRRPERRLHVRAHTGVPEAHEHSSKPTTARHRLPITCTTRDITGTQ